MRKSVWCVALAFASCQALAQGQVGPAPAPPSKKPAEAPNSTFQDPETCRYKLKARTAGASEKEDSGWSRSLGPLRLAAGPTDEGDAGVSLTGADSVVLLTPTCKGVQNFQGVNWRPVGRLDYSIDAAWTSASDSKNSASFSLRPNISWQAIEFVQGRSAGLARPASPVGPLKPEDAAAQLIDIPPSGRFEAPRPIAAVSLFADLRHRFGEVNNGNGGITRANQFIFGGGLEAAWTAANRFGGSSGQEPNALYGFFREAPRISVGYYSADDVDGNDVPVPKELSADFITVTTSFEVALPWIDSELYNSPVLLRYQYKGSEPTTGDSGYESFHNASLVYVMDAKASPALTFRTGEEQGLEYDRHVILGILWSFAGF